MATNYFLNQYFSTFLNVGGGIDASQTTGIVVQAVSGLDITKPGIACFSYSNPIDTSLAEWVTYTSIDGSNELQGVTRGTEGFAAKSHSNQAVVVFPLSESHINTLATALSIGGVATNGVTTTLDEDDMASNSATALATQQSIKAYVDGGWSTYSAVTPTSGTLDDPSFPIVFAGVDLTTTLYVGMRVKITQATVKYFIITAVAFSTDTTVTLYGGTDYDLVATGTTAITAFAYSAQKTPAGFPTTPAKWTVSATDTSARSQANPGTGWLNLGSVTISIPIGVWDVNYFVRGGWQSSGATTDFSIYSTLSTANNSESSNNWTAIYGGRWASVAGFFFIPLSRSGILTATSKTSYYLNTRTADAGAGITISNSNDTLPALITAVSAYL